MTIKLECMIDDLKEQIEKLENRIYALERNTGSITHMFDIIGSESKLEPKTFTPKWEFCTSIHSFETSPFCIRKVPRHFFETSSDLKHSGGIDTPSLCGKITPEKMGLNMLVWFEPTHNSYGICKKCLSIYLKDIGTE